VKQSRKRGNKATLQHTRTVFDGRRSISVALYMTLLVYGGMYVWLRRIIPALAEAS
jgi:hypothetical protein